LNKQGFSLLEVGVALIILSMSVMAVFQFISSTTYSVYSLENRTFARELANNRLSLTQTIEPFNGSMQPSRRGEAEFGGKKFYWTEELNDTSEDFSELTIRVGLDENQTIYQLQTFIEKK
jgi:type II secretion system protein I|tara:strand:+ start:85 stop:444 length:360 start_codon:yes stop_codon:yes gene_type:complete